MTGINEVAKQIHENAVDHGWWDEERGFPEIIALVIRSYQKRWRNTETGDCPPKFITRKAFVKKTEVYVCRTRRTNARIIRNNADRTSEASRKEYRSSLQT